MHAITAVAGFRVGSVLRRVHERSRWKGKGKRRGIRYRLVPLLITAVLAKLAGYARLEDRSDWARLRAADLTALFGLTRPTMPHQATWSRIFAHAIDLEAFEACLTSFFLDQRQRAEVPEHDSIVLTLDGKTLRGTIPAGQS